MNADKKSPGRFWQLLNSTGAHGEQLRRELGYGKWCLLWGITFLLSDFLLEGEIIEEPLAWLFPSLAVAVSLVVFYKYYQFLAGADELTRKIQVEGIAIGFGVGILLTMALESFADLGVPQLEANTIIVIMLFAWVGGQIWGHWKYR